jgi:hypothetical protein
MEQEILKQISIILTTKTTFEKGCAKNSTFGKSGISYVLCQNIFLHLHTLF